MALHFLTILLQTGEFLRINQLHQEEARNATAFPPLQRSGAPLSTNRPKTGFAFFYTPKDHFDNGLYDSASDYDNSEMRNNRSNISVPSDSADAADWLVFLTLETLGISGWIGNLTLLIVIISSGLLERPSFIFIASLAVADVFHATVTSCYFYPPIVLRRNVFNRAGIQFMNALDWTVWGITLTHMIAICLDRLVAIVLFQNYARLVTVKRAITISVTCWCAFAGVNILFSSMRLCCAVVPQPEFYTFGFEDPSASPYQMALSEMNVTQSPMNAYKPLYVPLECLAMLILAIGNPIILFNLYEKYRRKRTLRAASVVLMEVGQSLCRQSMNLDASLARDIKIFLQIIVVTVIFFVYMFIYYMFFYITDVSDKWSTMLNSICYSITHMINPVVYFSLNEQMQKQFKNIFGNLAVVKRRKAALVGRRNALCGIPSIVHAMLATAALSETSPLMRLSSGEQEESGQNYSSSASVHFEEHKSNICDVTKAILEENDHENDCEESTCAFTPLLSDNCQKTLPVYIENGQRNNGECKMIVIETRDFNCSTYGLEFSDGDVFV